MGMLGRLGAVIGAKANELLDHFDDPGEALDCQYELLIEEREGVERAIGDVAGAQQRLEREAIELRSVAVTLEERARDAVSAGDDFAAREALARGSVIAAGISALDQQADEVADGEVRFVEASRRLDGAIAELGVRKEVLKARYSATRERTEMNEVVSAVRADVEEIRDAVRRAESTVADVLARTRAIDRLVLSRALIDFSTSPASIEAELREARASEEVERALAQLKATLGASPTD